MRGFEGGAGEAGSQHQIETGTSERPVSGVQVLLLGHREECLLEPPPPHPPPLPVPVSGIESAAASGQGGDALWATVGGPGILGFFPKPPAATSLQGLQ